MVAYLDIAIKMVTKMVVKITKTKMMTAKTLIICTLRFMLGHSPPL